MTKTERIALALGTLELPWIGACICMHYHDDGWEAGCKPEECAVCSQLEYEATEAAPWMCPREAACRVGVWFTGYRLGHIMGRAELDLDDCTCRVVHDEGELLRVHCNTATCEPCRLAKAHGIHCVAVAVAKETR